MKRKLRVLVRIGRASTESKSKAIPESENRRELRTLVGKTGARDESPAPSITMRSVEGSFGLR